MTSLTKSQDPLSRVQDSGFGGVEASGQNSQTLGFRV